MYTIANRLQNNTFKTNAYSFTGNRALAHKPAQNSQISFTENNKQPEKKKYKNPIKSGFEYFNATAATLAAAAYAGVEALIWIDDPSLFIPRKTPELNIPKNKLNNKGLPGEIFKSPFDRALKPPKTLAGSLARIGAVSLAIGALYFITHLPKNLYEKKKEIFVKKKEMDVYSRNNEAEKALYERLDTEAKVADTERKRELAANLMKMRMAKQSGASQPPSFVKLRDLPN